MKCTITRESFLPHLQKVVNIVCRKAALPILHNIKLEAGGNELKLTAGNSLNDAALLFDRLGVNQLPVVSSGGRYRGFIAKNQVYDNYRKMLHKKQDLF